MPDTNETIADIANEIRGYFDLLKRGLIPDNVARMTTRQRHQFWADRLDAAAKREAIDAELKWTRIGYDERKAEERPGNSAALRDALQRLDENLCRDIVDGRRYFDALGYDPQEDISAALAAPARNCDKGFRDIEEYRLAFRREGQSHEDCADCPISKTDAFKHGVLCFFTWLLAPADAEAKGETK